MIGNASDASNAGWQPNARHTTERDDEDTPPGGRAEYHGHDEAKTHRQDDAQRDAPPRRNSVAWKEERRANSTCDANNAGGKSNANHWQTGDYNALPQMTDLEDGVDGGIGPSGYRTEPMWHTSPRCQALVGLGRQTAATPRP